MTLPKPYYEEPGITIYNADCRDLLPHLTADFIFADPPYGVDLQYNGHNDRELITINDWLPHCQRIAPTIVTPGYVNLYEYPKPDGIAIRYDKTAQSPARIAWMNKWEPILFYGTFPRLKWDVIETATQTERRREPLNHPCPKSVSLMRNLLTQLTEPGKTILDPFLGSGTTAKACKELGLNCIGIESDPEYCDTAITRLAQQTLPL